jgi:hypothetical protein
MAAMSTRPRRQRPALLALLTAATAGCAAAPARPERVRDSPAAFAHPEPDPGCRATVQEPLAANGLERVTVKVEVGPQGKLALVEFLEPDLSPAARLELRRAMEGCIWQPVLDAEGRPQPYNATFLRAGR